METKRRHGGWILHVLVFIVLFAVLFVQWSYMMRPHSNKAAYENMTQFTKETAPVDVLLIGGSSTFVYWMPMQAYHDHGFTSFNYSGNSMAPSLMKDLLIESRKSQTAKLYLIDLRALEIMTFNPTFYTEEYLRGYTDNLPYSLNRIRMISASLTANDVTPQNMASMYADLIYYHGNWRELTQEHFSAPDLSATIRNKGFYFQKMKPKAVTLTDYSAVTEESTLLPKVEQTMRELLDYCRSEELNVLFYVCPFSEQHDGIKPLFNALEKLVSGYGYSFLDMNDHYGEIGLDADTDYYNVNHVNVLGATKVTDYLGAYLAEHYDLPDHRGDGAFAPWDEAYAAFDEFRNNFVTEYRAENGLTTEEPQ